MLVLEQMLKITVLSCLRRRLFSQSIAVKMLHTLDFAVKIFHKKKLCLHRKINVVSRFVVVSV